MQANAQMQARLEAMEKEMKGQKKKDKKSSNATATPTPTHKAPSPASSASKTPSGTGPQQAEVSDSEDGDAEPSMGAKLGRLRRLCERKPSGKLNVPIEIHEKWAAKGHGREELLAELESCNFDTDRGWAGLTTV